MSGTRGELRGQQARGPDSRVPVPVGCDHRGGPLVPALQEQGPQIEPRDGAWVTELTDLVDLQPAPGTRLILRKERHHPGAQLRLTDLEGMRLTGLLTNTPPGGPDRQLAGLELRHRRDARVEDRTASQN